MKNSHSPSTAKEAREVKWCERSHWLMKRWLWVDDICKYRKGSGFMGWVKYIFHRHQWHYFGRFSNQFIFRCGVCHREKKVNIVIDGDYTPDKIDRIRDQMKKSTSHLHD